MEPKNWMFGRFSFSFRGDGFRFQTLVFREETSGWKTSLNPGRLKKLPGKKHDTEYICTDSLVKIYMNLTTCKKKI